MNDVDRYRALQAEKTSLERKIAQAEALLDSAKTTQLATLSEIEDEFGTSDDQALQAQADAQALELENLLKQLSRTMEMS